MTPLRILPILLASDLPALWSFIEHRPTQGHLLALAVRHARLAPLRIAMARIEADGVVARSDLSPFTARPAGAHQPVASLSRRDR